MQMEKLTFTTQAEAQLLAYACHGFLAQTNSSYAADIQGQLTSAWCNPAEELDANGNPTGVWYLWVTAELSSVDSRIAALFPVGTVI